MEKQKYHYDFASVKINEGSEKGGVRVVPIPREVVEGVGFDFAAGLVMQEEFGVIPDKMLPHSLPLGEDYVIVINYPYIVVGYKHYLPIEDCRKEDTLFKEGVSSFLCLSLNLMTKDSLDVRVGLAQANFEDFDSLVFGFEELRSKSSIGTQTATREQRYFATNDVSHFMAFDDPFFFFVIGIDNDSIDSLQESLSKRPNARLIEKIDRRQTN